MDARIKKLTVLGLSQEVAQKVVAAGLSTPALIRAASQEELEAADVTADDVAAIQLTS